MNPANPILRALAGDVYRPPFAEPIPLDEQMLQKKSAVSIVWRKWRPALSLWFHRQWPLFRPVIGGGHKRILWIYKGVPQVGDALMDLSGRRWLADRDVRIDLATDPHLQKLFSADRIFSKVFSDDDAVDPDAYDLVIMDSFKWRCIDAKVRRCPRVPFVTMRGFFNAPEFNRTLFSIHRMKQLLGEPAGQVPAAPLLFCTDADRDIAAGLPLPAGAVALALGGVAPSRTYDGWEQVVRILAASGAGRTIVLLGSANAIAMRDRIAAAAGNARVQVVDCVDRYSLQQTYAILQRCALAVCADGGLLHVANAAGVPTVSLFDHAVEPRMRLTEDSRSVALQSADAVSGIAAERVAAAVERALAQYGASA